MSEILLILVLISGIGSAAEIIVEPGNSIQTAVNNANSGDTITIKSGTYTENLNITTANLTIRSQSGNPDDTIIKAKRSTKDVLIVQAYNVTIRGIEVTGSESSYSGIYLYKCSNCVIENSKVINNGYGIRFGSSSKCTVSKNTVTNNEVYGIYLGSSSRNTISGNTAYNSYSGLYLGSSDYNTISGNNVTFNNNLGFYECSLCDHNKVYNNYFNNINTTVKGSENFFNVTKTAGTNIIGGPYIGGNYWGKPDGTGFSDTAVDMNGDGISDSTYLLPGGSTSTDYLPLVHASNPTAPEANFSSNVTQGYAPLSVQFTDLSKNATGWAWNFGDGATSAEHNPIHTYSTTGNYTVNLTVTNVYGTGTKLATINVSEKTIPVLPVANFTSNVSEGFAPLSVQFTDLSENAVTFNWDFGDGANSIEKNPMHTYSTDGIYTVNLTVSNANGINSKLATITVSEEPLTILPVAHFSSNVSEGSAPLTVQFTDLSENVTGWYWDFGDGSNSTDQSPVHTFSDAGDYTVNLTVSNLNGTSSATAFINVIPALFPVANFSSNVSAGFAPLSVQFTDLSENAVSWSWDFDNNGQSDSTVQNPVYVYETPGDYTVNLTVSNENGINSKLATINVTEKTVSVLAVANFTANVTEGFAPLSVQFTDLSENAISWSWDFGDGENSTEENPIHTYSTAGKYNVTLTVTNEMDNNTLTKYDYIYVKEVSEDDNEVNDDDNEVDDEDNEVSEDNEETCEDDEEVSEDDKETCGETKPVCEETKPVCEETKPVCKETKPVCKETKPVCKETKPVCEDTENVDEEEQTEDVDVNEEECDEDIENEVDENDEETCEDDEEVSQEDEEICEETKPVCEDTENVDEEEQTEDADVDENDEETCEETKPVCEDAEKVNDETENVDENEQTEDEGSSEDINEPAETVNPETEKV